MRKKIIIALMLGAATIGMVGCTEETGSQRSQNQQQKNIFEESNREVGMPNIKNFFEKKTAKKIWELRDNPDLTTYAYTQNMDGQYVYLGQCVGYGLPYTTQYTNPEEYYTSGAVLPQADPNSLYSSETTNATWLILVNEETGEQEVVYSEPEIIVTQAKLPKRLVADWSLPSNY